MQRTITNAEFQGKYKSVAVYTDFPLVPLVRYVAVTFLDYDGSKYALIEVNGTKYEVALKYLYTDDKCTKANQFVPELIS